MTDDPKSKKPETPVEKEGAASPKKPTPTAEALRFFPPISPDDPMLKRGWIVGGNYSKNSSPTTTTEKSSTNPTLTPEEEAEEERLSQKRFKERFDRSQKPKKD